MNIAIIGSGQMAEQLAYGFLCAGHKIFFGTNEEVMISTTRIFDYKNIEVCSIEDAGHIADIILMACDPEEVRASAYFLDEVKRKVIIDCTDNTPSAGWMDSINAIRKITGSEHIVKCTLSAGFQKKSGKNRNFIRLYVAGDSRKAKMVADILSRDLGLNDCYDFGGYDKVLLLEHMRTSRTGREAVA